MTDTTTIRHPERFDNPYFYFRTLSRSSDNYKEFVKRTGREPNIIYPRGWNSIDIDRVIGASHCVHFGINEFKETHNLNKAFEWNNQYQKDYVKNKLIKSNYQIEYFTTNFSINGNKRLLSSNFNVVPSSNYSDFLKLYKQLRLAQNESGKGVFILIFHTKNMEYFSPINFTGSSNIFGDDGLGVGSSKLKSDLSSLGDIIEPCFNEYFLFLLDAYIRQDFETLTDYLLTGNKNDLIRFDNPWEQRITQGIANNRDIVATWYSFCKVMEWILDCIHFDTIIGNSKQYTDFVDLVRSGKIQNEIITRFNFEYQQFNNQEIAC